MEELFAEGEEVAEEKAVGVFEAIGGGEKEGVARGVETSIPVAAVGKPEGVAEEAVAGGVGQGEVVGGASEGELAEIGAMGQEAEGEVAEAVRIVRRGGLWGGHGAMDAQAEAIGHGLAADRDLQVDGWKGAGKVVFAPIRLRFSGERFVVGEVAVLVAVEEQPVVVGVGGRLTVEDREEAGVAELDERKQRHGADELRQFPLAGGGGGGENREGGIAAGAEGLGIVRMAVVDERDFEGLVGGEGGRVPGAERIEIVGEDQEGAGATLLLAGFSGVLPVDPPAVVGDAFAFGLEVVGVGAFLEDHGFAPESILVGHPGVIGDGFFVEGAQQIDAVSFRKENGKLDLMGDGGGGEGEAQEEAGQPEKATDWNGHIH